ncbi:hypothetical protein BMS3Abin17_00048 [archaeon BMS3Abin17]|nr:hypothetical protein BMS3Abin17_00048 [archaeon BMS3Abin17]
MAFTEKKLGQNQINNVSNTTLYTVPTGKKGIIRAMILTNTTASDATISIWHVPNASSSADSNSLFKTFSVPANDFVHIYTYVVMDTVGDKIDALAGTASAITVSLYGAEI